MGKKISKQRTYNVDSVIAFRKTKESYGGLSNMAAGYPIIIDNINIKTSEALYQSLRYPLYPDYQKFILIQNSPMTAKMISKKYLEFTRSDWDDTRISIMRWCIRIKLLQNWDSFGTLLLSTGNMPIVELSRKDRFWGAVKLNDSDDIVGVNALGRLLMELRNEIPELVGEKELRPPKIKDFKFMGKEVKSMYFNNSALPKLKAPKDEQVDLF